MDIPFFPGSKMKPRIAYFLGKLTVNLVKISSKEPNMQVPELPSYTFKRPIAARKENAEALIREWMGITEQINKPNPFEDTYHGESVLLSLNFFKKAGKVNPDLMDFLETKDHKIERDCLGNFGELGASITLSKRFCSSCAVLVDIVNEKRVQLLTLEEHEGLKVENDTRILFM